MQTITREELAVLLKTANIKPRLKRELRFVPEEITDWEDRDFYRSNHSQPPTGGRHSTAG